MAANTQFTIYNVSTAPLSYQGQTIAAGGNYTPASLQQAIFASDPGLIADTLGGRVLIAIGLNSWSTESGVKILNAAALLGTSGVSAAAAPINTSQVGGIDGSGNLQALLTDSTGRLRVDGSSVTQPISGTVTASPGDGTRATYSAAVQFSAAASATDVFTISGSSSKTVRIRKFLVTATATAGRNATVFFVKRSSANTGGTSTTPPSVPYDSQNAAATAAVRSYTANPSALGTSVGNVSATIMFLSGGGTIGSDPTMLADLLGPEQAFTLRGAAESLCVNLDGVTISGNVFRITVIWTEE